MKTVFTSGTGIVLVVGTVRNEELSPSCRLLTIDPSPLSSALTCAQFHPDGLIFGTGTMDSQIKIWDLKVGHAGLIWVPEGEGTDKLWRQVLEYLSAWERRAWLCLCGMSVIKELGVCRTSQKRSLVSPGFFFLT